MGRLGHRGLNPTPAERVDESTERRVRRCPACCYSTPPAATWGREGHPPKAPQPRPNADARDQRVKRGVGQKGVSGLVLLKTLVREGHPLAGSQPQYNPSGSHRTINRGAPPEEGVRRRSTPHAATWSCGGASSRGPQRQSNSSRAHRRFDRGEGDVRSDDARRRTPRPGVVRFILQRPDASSQHWRNVSTSHWGRRVKKASAPTPPVAMCGREVHPPAPGPPQPHPKQRPSPSQRATGGVAVRDARGNASPFAPGLTPWKVGQASRSPVHRRQG